MKVWEAPQPEMIPVTSSSDYMVTPAKQKILSRYFKLD